jgi:hypothetical protein
MYRHALYINCSGCGRSLEIHESEFDEEGRDICQRCNALRRVDRTLDRWRRDARSETWLHLGAAGLAVALVATVPGLIAMGGLVLFAAAIARANKG